MTTPDSTACCPDAYYCPADADTKCPRHGLPGACCDKPGRHIPMDRQDWHRGQERLERAWLDSFARARIRNRDLYRGKDRAAA